jgi:3-oxoadipate enol-lactonase
MTSAALASPQAGRRLFHGDYSDDAAALLTDQGWDEALVIGVSFGGMVAQELALRHPSRVSRLVLALHLPRRRGRRLVPVP